MHSYGKNKKNDNGDNDDIKMSFVTDEKNRIFNVTDGDNLVLPEKQGK